MKRNKGLVIGILLSFVLLLLATPARAQVSLPHTETLPADTTIFASSSMTELLRMSFNLQAGESAQVTGKGVAKNVLSVEVLQAARVECIKSTASWGTAEYINSTRNNLGVNEASQYVDGLPLEARYIYTAPTVSTYTCRLTVRIDRGNWGTIPPDQQKMDFLHDVTYLKVVSIGDGNSRWGTDYDTYAPGFSETYLTPTNASQNILNSQPWTADRATATINAYSDVELTSCKNGTSSCPSQFYGTSTTASVTTQLVVEQLDANDQTCATISTTPKTYTITNDIHHLKNYNYLAVPVTTTATCLARYRSHVAATWNSGNPVKIEPGDFIGGPKFTGYSVAWFSNQ